MMMRGGITLALQAADASPSRHSAASARRGGNPTRYAVHQLVGGATASGAGITPLFEVTPAIRPGAATGSAVALVKPPLKAVLIPGQAALARPVVTEGITLDFIQTLG